LQATKRDRAFWGDLGHRLGHRYNLSRQNLINARPALWAREALIVHLAESTSVLSGPLGGLLDGVVELDETYVGAKHKRGTKRGRPGLGSHKTPVFALVQRGGQVRAFPMDRVTAKNINAALRGNVAKGSRIMTDQFNAYKSAKIENHATVNHSLGEYVRGEAHTNTAEGFFSLLKRGINGSFHHVSKGHLHRYCDEFAFRYNNRIALGVNDGERAAKMVRGAEGKRLTYKQPSGASAN